MNITKSRAINLIIKYGAIAYINLQARTAHFIDVVAKAPITMFRLWLLHCLYTITLRTHLTLAATTTLPQLMWTLMIIQAFTGRGHPRIAEIINEEAQTGLIAYSINRPCSYLLFHYFGWIGRSVPLLLARLVAGAGATLILVGPPPISAVAIAPTITLLIGGFTLDFLIGFSIGVLALWLEDSVALDYLYSKLLLIVGGFYIPLSLFPAGLRTLLEYLPFSHLSYSAGYLLTHFEWQLFIRFFFLQMAWITLAFITATWLFKKGMRYVSISGG